MVDWQQKLTNYISVYLLCSKKFVRNILLLSCGELVGLFICASYIARSAPGLGQLQHPLAFSGTSHIFQLQLHLGSPHSAPKKEQEEIGVSDDQAGLCCMVGKVGFVQGTFVQVTFVLVTFVQMKKLT